MVMAVFFDKLKSWPSEESHYLHASQGFKTGDSESKTEQLSSMSSLTAAAAALVDTTEQKQNDTMA